MAPKSSSTHHLVEFASRYARSPLKTLSAGGALWRAEALVEDLDSLSELRVEADKNGISFGYRGRTFEIVSYYAVGFATCLEWHARSRLVDLMLFRPNSIEKEDVKKLADVALS